MAMNLSKFCIYTNGIWKLWTFVLTFGHLAVDKTSKFVTVLRIQTAASIYPMRFSTPHVHYTTLLTVYGLAFFSGLIRERLKYS